MTTTENVTKKGMTSVTVKAHLGRSSYSYTLYREKKIDFSGSKNHDGPPDEGVVEFYENVFTHARRLP